MASGAFLEHLQFNHLSLRDSFPYPLATELFWSLGCRDSQKNMHVGFIFNESYNVFILYIARGVFHAHTHPNELVLASSRSEKIETKIRGIRFRNPLPFLRRHLILDFLHLFICRI